MVKPDFDPSALEKVLGGPVELRPVTSGQSNPTWFVTCGTRDLVLRKKPSGTTLSSAHAVDREYTVMNALRTTSVPVPAMVLFEADETVLGTPFYLMQRLEGTVSEDSSLPELDVQGRETLYADAAQTLAQLHRVDWNAVGLAEFGRSDGYYARQVKRWSRQWEATCSEANPRIEELTAWFRANIPAENKTTIVHGDYRIGNLMYDPATAHIRGVLDWELSTLGDPMADLAHWLMFYEFAPSQLGGIAGLGVAGLGIPSASRFLDLYREAGGEEAECLPFHRAFAFYRMAIIFEGILARARTGQAASADALEVGALAPVCTGLAEKIISKDICRV
ncbi:phosphotransferase family protein [Sagittula sp. NFXS13]|uniref:phosphotransferase family protein n=1 Tax=Sagittula sp. NFXS13 TaxID=2819095 RepID=UPI0032DEB49A